LTVPLGNIGAVLMLGPSTMLIENDRCLQACLLSQIEEYRKLPLQALRTKYQKLFGESPRSGHKDYLFRRIAWRLQANRYGDLSDQARQRALAIADDRDLRLRIPQESALKNGAPVPGSGNHRRTDLRLPLPGTVLTRSFKGKTVKVGTSPGWCLVWPRRLPVQELYARAFFRSRRAWIVLDLIGAIGPASAPNSSYVGTERPQPPCHQRLALQLSVV
jgi:hypothetical protein